MSWDLLAILLSVHTGIGLASGILVAVGAMLEARENPRAFDTRVKRAQLCAQIFCVTLLPVVMWALSLIVNRRRP